MYLWHAGLVFDESVGPDKTLEPSQVKPKVRLNEDPKQSKVSYIVPHLHVAHAGFILGRGGVGDSGSVGSFVSA